MGDRVQMPEWADPAALARLFQDDRPPISCWLVRDAVIACIVLQTEPAGARQSPLGEPLEVDAGGVRLRLDGEAGQQATRWLSPNALPAALAGLSNRFASG